MEKDPAKRDNVEYLRPVIPELVVIWRGLEIVVTNTRMNREDVINMLDGMDDTPQAA